MSNIPIHVVNRPRPDVTLEATSIIWCEFQLVNNPTHPMKYNVPPAIKMAFTSSLSMSVKLVHIARM